MAMPILMKLMKESVKVKFPSELSGILGSRLVIPQGTFILDAELQVKINPHSSHLC